MTVFQLARGVLGLIAGAAAEFIRPHACHFGGPGCFKSHSLTDIERHYFWDHAGDRMTPPKGRH